MKISTLIPAALLAVTITGAATASQAGPTTEGDYVTRAVRSPNGKDPFVRVVKVPKAAAVARSRDCPMMKERTATPDLCDRMMGDHRGSDSASKG